jgi:hypothetical protein
MIDWQLFADKMLIVKVRTQRRAVGFVLVQI